MSNPWNLFDMNRDGKMDAMERAFEAQFLNEVLFKDEEDEDEDEDDEDDE